MDLMVNKENFQKMLFCVISHLNPLKVYANDKVIFMDLSFK